MKRLIHVQHKKGENIVIQVMHADVEGQHAHLLTYTKVNRNEHQAQKEKKIMMHIFSCEK